MDSHKNSFPLTDLIYGVLGLTFLSHKDDGFTRVSRADVYSILSILAEKNPEYFPDVYFNKDGGSTYSKQVEDALFRLGGVICEEAPRYKYLRFDENELTRIEANLQEWFSDEDKKILEKLAEEFYRELKRV